MMALTEKRDIPGAMIAVLRVVVEGRFAIGELLVFESWLSKSQMWS